MMFGYVEDNAIRFDYAAPEMYACILIYTALSKYVIFYC